jgi:predicted SAM-dependent methyltransferase
MDRLSEIGKYVKKDLIGIEVAPYFNPIFPKSAGYKILLIDVFDTKTLQKNARNDPNILPEWVNRIEDVDIVGDASNIGEMVQQKDLAGKIDYIVSSHNFEHLPNPIKFLRGCGEALKPGGVLSMAVPDYRACFDHFRMPTRLSDWLSALHENRSQPNAETIFDFEVNNSAYMKADVSTVGCDLEIDDCKNFVVTGSLQKAYDGYLDRISGQTAYKDAHCTVMFPETLELLMRDVSHLGLVDLEFIEVSQTNGLEFYIHLRKPINTVPKDTIAYAKTREDLLRKINASLGAAPYILRSKRAENKATRASRISAFKGFLSAIIGKDRYQRIREKNRKRRRKDV